jgi:hypothetical protein
MFKPPNAVFVEMCLSLRALVQETCIQKEMIFADFFTEFSFKLNSKDYSCGCMRMFLHSYKWTTSFGFHMTWIVIFLENSLPMLFDGPGHREKLDVLIYSEANSTYC